MMDPTRARARRRGDRIEFQLVYLATLPAFLVGALLARLGPGRRPDHPDTRLSVFGEARAAARTCGSFALMG